MTRIIYDKTTDCAPAENKIIKIASNVEVFVLSFKNLFTAAIEMGGAMWKCLWAYANSEGPDQPAHTRSLIRAFTARRQIHWILQNVRMESKDPDNTLNTFAD